VTNDGPRVMPAGYDGGFFLKDRDQSVCAHVHARSKGMERDKGRITFSALAPGVTSQTELSFTEGELEELAVMCQAMARDLRHARATERVMEKLGVCG
jgi:hypothetical protein